MLNAKFVFYTVLVTAFLVIHVTASTANSDDKINRQDGRLIEKLQWFSPNGELPGTYVEYLETHPRVNAVISEPIQLGETLKSASKNISLLVDATLYPQISTSLDQYISDLQAELYNVYLHTISGGTSEEIKEWLSDRYALGDSCFVFVGDITAAWAEVQGSVFPCDLFYMDLDGYWGDPDGDGIYQHHEPGTGDMGPELYIGRIYAHTLDYDSEANMVNDYFTKVHAYREGDLTQPWRGLEYVEEDWFDMYVALDLIYDDDVTRYDYGFYTTGADYLEQMALGQHFVQVCAHSFSGGHHFGTRPTESAAYAHVYVNSPVSRSARLLLGSNDGIKVWLNGNNVYTNDRIGNWIQDQFTVNVTLNAGWNNLLCKISQDGGDYGFSARFADGLNYSFDDLQYQMNDPDSHGPEAEFIRGWLLNGFHEDISDNFWSYLTTNYLGVTEALINPSEGEIMGGKTWSTYDSEGPFVDMSDYDEDDYGACYAFTRFSVEASKSCQLWLGYEDGARIWLNGSQILNDNRYGDYIADMSKINVTLNAGENRILIKVSEWMGAHGFSARFSNADGTAVDGITYEIEPSPIAHICTWLVNGPYINPDFGTRLSTDYLGGEATIEPDDGDTAPFGSWERVINNGRPFDLGTYYSGEGDWVYSSTIQTEDPPVLFYNLFACGPGRFTDDDYLAGAYIFNTTYGLITVASAKSGSMLNFQDFTASLGENKNLGEAYYDWFNAQAPFVEWEKEWYYGMVLNGDPTLKLVLEDYYICGDANTDVTTDVSDAVYIINYIFAGGNPPVPIESGDVNCDDTTNVSDAVWIINYIFVGGNQPCDSDGDAVPDC
jgi:Dockerin type I domain